MSSEMDQYVSTINNQILWLRENANVSKALSHPAGISVFRDIVLEKMNVLIDRIKSLGRGLLSYFPNKSHEIKSHGQEIMIIYNRIEEGIKNPQMNIARAFNEVTPDLSNLISRVDDFLRFVPPSYSTNNIVEERVPYESPPPESPSPSLDQLFTEAPQTPEPISNIETNYQPIPLKTSYTSNIPTSEDLLIREEKSIEKPPLPDAIPPRNYSNIPVIDKILDVQHKNQILQQESNYLKQRVQYEKNQANYSSHETINNQISRFQNEINRLQNGIKAFENERNHLIERINNLTNILRQKEVGNHQPTTELNDEINRLIVENHDLRKRLSFHSFQNVEDNMTSLRSQIERLIEENKKLRFNTQ
ncbi:MAG: hypothetical protein ACTSUV_02725 [Candidatus Ranarchaeia archaeon]